MPSVRPVPVFMRLINGPAGDTGSASKEAAAGLFSLMDRRRKACGVFEMG
jgi:hypothetical protein